MIVGKSDISIDELVTHISSVEEFCKYSDSLIPEIFRSVTGIVGNQRYLCCLVIRNSNKVSWDTKKKVLPLFFSKSKLCGYVDCIIEGVLNFIAGVYFFINIFVCIKYGVGLWVCAVIELFYVCRRLQDKNELFSVINEVESCGDSGVIEIANGKVKEVDVLALIDILAVNFESFLNRNPEFLRNVQDADFDSVKEYLKFTIPALNGNEKLLNSVIQGFTTMHYMLYRNATSSYMIIPNRFLSGTAADGDDNVWGGLLSVTGHIIVIKETVLHTEIPYIMYCSVKEFIDANKGHRDITWRYADI